MKIFYPLKFVHTFPLFSLQSLYKINNCFIFQKFKFNFYYTHLLMCLLFLKVFKDIRLAINFSKTKMLNCIRMWFVHSTKWFRHFNLLCLDIYTLTVTLTFSLIWKYKYPNIINYNISIIWWNVQIISQLHMI